MREIWFRGKRIDNGEWTYGDLVTLHDGRRFIINNRHGACVDGKGNFINTEAPFVCEVILSTVGQYTGLTDKNGKKIFEGDIAEKHVQGNILVTRGVINWDQKNAGWAHQLNGMNPSLCLFVPKAWEVIGNIQDNPELLEVNK